jgi:hypothetical protein
VICACTQSCKKTYSPQPVEWLVGLDAGFVSFYR